MSTFLSVVIPAYNESENILPTVNELEGVIESCSEISDYEVMIIDDHSSDGTFQNILSLNKRNPRIQGIRLSRRSGSHIALRAGIGQARGDIVLFLAADGQDDPRLLSPMLAKLNSGNHVVWAVRQKRKTSWAYNLMVGLAYRFIALLVPSMPLDRHLAGADFFMFSREFKEALNGCRERHTSIFGLMTWAGFKHDSITYERRPRLSGESKWKFRTKWKLMVDWIAAFSGIPLKITSLIGLFFLGASFIFSAFLFYFFLVHRTVTAWAWTADLFLFTAGLQMFLFGIVGEYLWRNLEETRMRPLYFIESTTREPSCKTTY